jgi:pilus assembly protein TadC
MKKRKVASDADVDTLVAVSLDVQRQALRDLMKLEIRAGDLGQAMFVAGIIVLLPVVDNGIYLSH